MTLSRPQKAGGQGYPRKELGLAVLTNSTCSPQIVTIFALKDPCPRTPRQTRMVGYYRFVPPTILAKNPQLIRTVSEAKLHTSKSERMQ